MTANSGTAQTQQKLIKAYTEAILRGIHALGFDNDSLGEKHKIVFNTQMFVKPNSKAFEVIVHFLLSNLDPERATRLFAKCWPPLCKETIKEFKDAIFNWLSELAGTSSVSTTTTTTTGMARNSNSEATTGTKSIGTGSYGQIPPAHARLLQLVKIPPVIYKISKSLLAVPCGTKACEILFTLVVFVTLMRTIRLMNGNKSCERILPKASSVSLAGETGGKQPFNPMSTNSFSSVRCPGSRSIDQLSIQKMTFDETKKFKNEQLSNLLANHFGIKNKEKSDLGENLIALLNILEMKKIKSQSVASKRKLICSELGLNDPNDVNQPLELYYSKLDAHKKVEFDRHLLELEQIMSRTISNSQIEQLLTNSENLTEMDGQEMVNFLTSENFNHILNLAKENSDSNCFPLFNLDDLLKDRKLDLISLMQLVKSFISLKNDLIFKADLAQIGERLNTFFSNSSELRADRTLSASSFEKNKAANEELETLYKKVDTVGPAVRESLKKLVQAQLLEADSVPKEKKEKRFEHDEIYNVLDEKFFAIRDRKIVDSNLLGQDRNELELTQQMVTDSDKAFDNQVKSNKETDTLFELDNTENKDRDRVVYFDFEQDFISSSDNLMQDGSLGIIDLDESADRSTLF